MISIFVRKCRLWHYICSQTEEFRYVESVILSIVYGFDEVEHVEHFSSAGRELKAHLNSGLSPTIMINLFPFRTSHN